MGQTANDNIPSIAKSLVNLPSTEVFLLFFDTENSNHLTGVKNISGVKTFFDYENPFSQYTVQTVQTIGVIPQSITITVPDGYLAVASEHKITGLNLLGTLGYAEILQSTLSPTGAIAQNSPVLSNDFLGATVVLTYPTATTILITFTGIALQTINWKVSTNLSPQNI